MTPRFVGEAVADLIDLEDFFEATWPGSRARLAADLDDFLVRVSTHPLVFARTTGSVRGRNVREGLLDAFPVRVAYEVTPPRSSFCRFNTPDLVSDTGDADFRPPADHGMNTPGPILTCGCDGPPVASEPAWLTETVCGLAVAIDADRGFDRLPILADALEDAGCEDAAVLRHCRECPRHAAGCWVVRGILEMHLPPTVSLVVAPPERVVEAAAGGGETWAAWLLAAGVLISLTWVVLDRVADSHTPRPASLEEDVAASGRRQPPVFGHFEEEKQEADAPHSLNPLPTTPPATLIFDAPVRFSPFAMTPVRPRFLTRRFFRR